MKAKLSVLMSMIVVLVIALSGSVSIAAAQSSTTSSPSVAGTTLYVPIVGKNGSAAASVDASTTASLVNVSTAGTATTSSYSPQPSDAQLIRDKVYLDFAKSHLIFAATSPLTVAAYLVGSLPDPCHLLRITKSLASSANIINIDVYSLVKPGTACITVLQPFTVTYPLGSFSPGLYTVKVNGTTLGTFGNSLVSSSSATGR